MADILLLGGGGHARVLIDAIRAAGQHRVIGVVDRDKPTGTTIDGVPVIGTDEDLEEIREIGIAHAAIAVGSIGDVSTRARLAERAAACGYALPPIVHPAAHVASNATLGEGAFIAAGAVVGAGAEIGRLAIVNSGSIVDHECRLGAFVHLAPGASLSGDVRVGERTHIGTGTAVSNGVTIGDDVLIGAGAAVVADVPSGVLAYGNPCRVIRSRS